VTNRVIEAVAAAADALLKPSAHPSILESRTPAADPVDEHAAEVTEQLGLRGDQLAREHTRSHIVYAEHIRQLVREVLDQQTTDVVTGSGEWLDVTADEVTAALHFAGHLRGPDRVRRGPARVMRAPDDPIFDQLRERNRQYGRASRTIGELRGQLALLRDRLHDRELVDATAVGIRGADVDTAARSTIAEALGLPADSTTGAIVVGIRGLREAAENPVVEVDASQVSLPIAAAVDAREQLRLSTQREEILRRDNERLRIERQNAWSNPPSPTDWSRLLQSMARIEKAVGTEGLPPAATAKAVENLASPGLQLSELFDNPNPQQDEARSTPTDGGEPQ